MPNTSQIVHSDSRLDVSYSISVLLPHTVLALAASLMLLGATVSTSRRIWGPLCLLTLFGTAICLGITTQDSASANNMTSDIFPVVQEPLGIVFQWFSLGVVFLVVLMTISSHANSPVAVEQYGLILLSLLGMMLVCVANDLIAILLAFELIVLPASILVFLNRRSRTELRQVAGDQTESVENIAVKFLVWNITASVAALLGGALIYGIGGITNLTLLRRVFDEIAQSSMETAPSPFVLSFGALGVVFLLVGLAARMWIIPAHLILADVYEANRSWLNAFVTVALGVPAFVVIVRVLVHTTIGIEATGQVVSLVVALGTMTLGHLLALTETRIRRILAYLTTAQAGFVLAALAVGFWNSQHPQLSRQLTNGVHAAVLTVLTTAVCLIGIHAVFAYLCGSNREIEYTDDLSGLIRHQPLAATILLVCFLSLMGVPPLAGFWSRLFVVASAFDVRVESPETELLVPLTSYFVLGMFVIVNCVLAAIVGLRLIVVVVFHPPAGQRKPSGGQASLAAAMLSAILAIAVGLLPGPLIDVVGTIEHPIVGELRDQTTSQQN